MLGLFKKAIKIYAPMNGNVVDITEIDDPVFSQKMVGDGVAIIPESMDVLAPMDGEITQFFETGHAFSIKNGDIEILVHVGMDTVELKGEGFTKIKKVGDTVKHGDVILKVDLQKIEENGKKIDTPIVVMDAENREIKKITGAATAGETVIMEVK